jgi:hypothetical protein
MKTKTGILAISAVILLTSLSVSPALAATTTTPDLSMTDTQVTKLDKILPSFMNDLALVKDEQGFTQLVNHYFFRYRDQPVFRFFHRIAVHRFIQRHILCFSHLRTSAWVISYGAINRLFSHQLFHISLYRPFTLWFYGNLATPLTHSRTFVIDFHPFSIMNVNGRQIGWMHDFVGFYLERNRPFIGGDYTFFAGHVGRIRAYDLSPLN